MSPLTVTLPPYSDSPPVDEDEEERDEDAEEEELDVNVVPADCSASVFKLCNIVTIIIQDVPCKCCTKIF